MKKTFTAISLVVMLAMVLGACAQPTAAPQPTAAAAQPTEAPAQPTAAPVQPTAAPAAGGGKTLTIWHGYHTGGSEEATINQIADAYRKANPDVTLNVLEVPFDQLFNKWETEVAAGGGPDMFTAPNDSLGKEVRAGLVLDITDKMQGKLDGVAPLSIAALTVDGKLYAVPLIPKAVALYYNKSTIPTPPATTDDLLALVKSGKKLVLFDDGAYHTFGFFNAFGSPPWNDKGECVNTQAVADAYTWMAALNTADPNTFQSDQSKGSALFTQGQADMIVNGPWVLGDYEKALGDKLGLVPMPAGPKGKAGPLTGLDGWYINPNSQNVDLALAAAQFFANKDSQTLYADNAGDPPARTDVTPKDPFVKAFADAAGTGYPRPQGAFLDNFWGNFQDSLQKMVGGKLTPADAAVAACTAMNKGNKIDVTVPVPTAGSAPAPTAAAAASTSTDLGLTGPLAGKSWDDLVAMAKGSEVDFWMWGGSEPINKWINGWFATALKDKYGITLKQVPVSDATGFINQVLGEKQAGKDTGGAVDFMWINGENFRTMKNGGLLYGPWAKALPSAQYYNWDDAAISYDFGFPTDGYEMPWGAAQVVLEYDTARVTNPPTTMAGLVDWIKAHPGRFAYPAPPDFTGSVWVRMMCYYATGGYKQFLGDFNQALFDQKFPACWKLLNDIKPSLWRQGQTYPESLAKNRDLFTGGEIDFNMTYGPGDAQNYINQGLYPKTVKTYVLDDGTIANTNYVAVAYNASHLAAALVASNFLASPEVQLQYTKDQNWLAPLDPTKLPADMQAAFKAVDRGAATVPDDVLAAHKLPELQATWLTAIENGWKANVLQK